MLAVVGVVALGGAADPATAAAAHRGLGDAAPGGGDCAAWLSSAWAFFVEWQQHPRQSRGDRRRAGRSPPHSPGARAGRLKRPRSATLARAHRTVKSERLTRGRDRHALRRHGRWAGRGCDCPPSRKSVLQASAMPASSATDSQARSWRWNCSSGSRSLVAMHRNAPAAKPSAAPKPCGECCQLAKHEKQHRAQRRDQRVGRR